MAKCSIALAITPKIKHHRSHIRGGTFYSVALESVTMSKHSNTNPQPFGWTELTRTIIQKVKRAKSLLEATTLAKLIS